MKIDKFEIKLIVMYTAQFVRVSSKRGGWSGEKVYRGVLRFSSLVLVAATQST